MLSNIVRINRLLILLSFTLTVGINWVVFLLLDAVRTLVVDLATCDTAAVTSVADISNTGSLL